MRKFWWMNLPVFQAEGVDGGGSGDGAAAAGADAGGGAAGAADGGAAAGEGFKVAVDGTVPDAKAAEGEGTKDPAAASGEADPAAEGDAEKKDGEGDVGGDKKKDDEFAFKPEDYAFTLPDGAEADPVQAEQFTAFAIENKVPPELAQKLVDFHSEAMQRQVKAWTDQVATWAEETRNDPEYGGANYDQNMAIANRALAEFGGPKLGEAARLYGWGNHPEFVRFMVNVGKALGAPTTEKGGGQGNAGTEIPLHEALYGKAK